MTWTDPSAYSAPLTDTVWNRDVKANLEFLYNKAGVWLPTPSQDMSAAPKATGIKLGCYLVPVVCQASMTLTQMAYRSDTAAGHVDLGIYLDDGNDKTVSKVSTTGLNAMPGGAGPKSFSLVEPADVVPFQKYWLVIGFDVASCAVLGTNGPLLPLARRASSGQTNEIVPLPTVLTFDVTGADPNTTPVVPSASPCLAALP